jgi:hypothetical protein
MNDDLVENALVRWTGGDGVGVVRRIANGRIEVQWDAPGEQTPSVGAPTSLRFWGRW